MIKYLSGLMLLFTITVNAEQSAAQLEYHKQSLQLAKQQLAQRIASEQQAIQQLQRLLAQAEGIDTSKPIRFAGQTYTESQFHFQLAQLQQQHRQKKHDLQLSEQEYHLLENRISVLGWRIQTLIGNQEAPQP